MPFSYLLVIKKEILLYLNNFLIFLTYNSQYRFPMWNLPSLVRWKLTKLLFLNFNIDLLTVPFPKSSFLLNSAVLNFLPLFLSKNSIISFCAISYHLLVGKKFRYFCLFFVFFDSCCCN